MAVSNSIRRSRIRELFLSLRGRLLLFFLVFSFIPVVFIGIAAYESARTAIQTRASEELTRLATIEASRINEFMADRIADTQVFANDPGVRTLDPEAITATIQRISKAWPIYQGIAITGPDGLSIANNMGKSLDNSKNPAFQKAIKGQVTVAEPFISGLTGDLIIAVFAPVQDEQGNTIATASMSVTTQAISEMLAEAQMGDTGEAYLINSTGMTLTPSRFTDTLKEKGLIKERFELEMKVESQGAVEALAGNTGVDTYTNYSGQAVVGAYAPIPDRGWALLVEQQETEAFEGAYQLRGLVSLSVLAVLVLAFFAALLVAQTITRPITHLADITTDLANGHLDRRADEGDSEMGNLGRAFNQMAAQLNTQFESERQQRHHLQITVDHYVAYLRDVARGSLSRRLTLNTNGGANEPLTVLGSYLNEMTVFLERLVNQVRDTSANLSSVAAEILAATSEQASGASEQSAAIAQTTTTVDEVRAIAEKSSHQAKEVTGSAQRTVDISRSGQDAMKETIDSMVLIKNQVEGIASNILALSEQTQQIGEIISTVNEISSQSNMLALNASVEAARAGEHGKGFSVVAMEVRNLAEQSRQATQQVKLILSEIQKATNATVMATEEGTKGVERGVQLANQARQSIDQLSKVIGESAQSASQMAAGSQQQVSGVEQVAMAMQNINQATIQSLASTRQTERAAQNLNELARQLTDIVAQFEKH